MDKFHSFLLDLKSNGADVILIESIIEAHSVIFYEGPIDRLKEKLLNIPDPNVIENIRKNPYNIKAIDEKQYKLYAKAFVDSCGRWLATLSKGLDGTIPPFFYWHEALYKFTRDRLIELINILAKIKREHLLGDTDVYLDTIINEYALFIESQKAKHQAFINGPGSANAMKGVDPIKNMDRLIQQEFGQQTNLRYKDFANRVGYFP